MQRKVQTLLGRCLIRLQQYVLLAKALLSNDQVSGPIDKFAALHAVRRLSISSKPLGTVTKELFGSYVMPELVGPVPERLEEVLTEPNSFSFRFCVELSGERCEAIQAETVRLVALRNDLVHHFIDRHDPEPTRAAQAEGAARAA